LEEVRIFITVPDGVRAAHLDIVIKPAHLKIGLKGNPPFLDHDFAGTVVEEECTWTLDGKELEITLQKMRKAETWSAAFKGHTTLNPLEEEEVKKKLTLERFQEEHKGFDFSGAEFSGSAPDPRTFLEGVKYKN
jgi:CS domain